MPGAVAPDDAVDVPGDAVDDGDDAVGSGTHHSAVSRSPATSRAVSPGANVTASPCGCTGSATRVGRASDDADTGASYR